MLFFALAVLLTGIHAREVVFIGLSGEGAPAIEKSFTRLLQEQFAVIPDVHATDDVELERLRAKIESYSYPHLTAPLLSALARFTPDSALVIWGMVKECSLKPVRHYFVKAALSGTLTIELSIYNLANRSYVYIGDATATAEIPKGFVFWESVDESVKVSALDRNRLMSDLELKTAADAGRIMRALVTHEKKRHDYVENRYAQIPGIEKKPVPSDSGADTLKKPHPTKPKTGSPEAPTSSSTAPVAPAPDAAAAAAAMFSPRGSVPDSAQKGAPAAQDSAKVDSVGVGGLGK
jgi:hypothetical protein